MISRFARLCVCALALCALPLASQDRARFFSICGIDQRAPMERKLAIGRLYSTTRGLPVCTAWLAPNGVFVTAGHCVALGFDELDFDVPQSSCDGSPRRPGPWSRFQVDPESVVSGLELEDGQDWALFRVLPNAAIGLPRYMSEGGALELARSPVDRNQPRPIFVAGFGDDYREHDGCFHHNRILQSAPATGQNGADERDCFYHGADTHIGNSGSPVFSYDAGGHPVVHGIHRGGNCPNVSTAVLHPEFVRALREYGETGTRDLAFERTVYAAARALRRPARYPAVGLQSGLVGLKPVRAGFARLQIPEHGSELFERQEVQ